MIGETIGHFEIIARAGRGGMGEVFVAEHATIKTKVAIKVLHAEVSTNTTHVQRFFNEARAVARIQHAGIVRIFDVGFHANGRAYLIMEHLEGETLAGRLRRAGRLAPRTAAEIARQIASILDATHHAGVIHRDLKPENVFLVRDRELASGERVKILDFGIAKLSNTLAGPTTVGTMGTPAYMAPEQWSDSGSVDWRADLYSLGCIVYEMVAGRPPFTSGSIAEACAKHLNETPQPIRYHTPDIPSALDALVLDLLAKDPAQRVAAIASIDALEQRFIELGAAAPPADGDALADLPSGPVASSVTTLSAAISMAPSSPPPPPLYRRRAAKLAGLAAAALAGVAVWQLVGTGEPRGAPPASQSVVEPPPRIDAAIDAAIDAPPTRLFADWLEAANPFVASHGARWLAHQVTRREYRRFLEAMPVSEALRAQPVTGWDDSDPMRPVAWLTFERAAAFCRAIDAQLPTSEQWLAASAGAWGLDPAGVGHPGPLREWTSTVRDGLVVVHGGHERMSPADRKAAATEPMMKSSEAQAGANPAPNIVASETIGFRCVR